MTKVAIKILQGSTVTQKYVTLYIPWLQMQYAPAKNYENRLSHVKVTSDEKVGPFIETSCTITAITTTSTVAATNTRN